MAKLQSLMDVLPGQPELHDFYQLESYCTQYGCKVCMYTCVVRLCVKLATYWLNLPICWGDGVVLRAIGGNKTMNLSCCLTPRALGCRNWIWATSVWLYFFNRKTFHTGWAVLTLGLLNTFPCFWNTERECSSSNTEYKQLFQTFQKWSATSFIVSLCSGESWKTYS